MAKPHILWPAAVISLLTFSALTIIAVVWASRSDGGAQVVDDYYRKSVAWDSLSSAQSLSDNLSWAIDVEVDHIGDSGQLLITINNENGVGIEGLTGHATLSRPHRAEAEGKFEVVELEERSGRYSIDFPRPERGLWDVALALGRDSVRFQDQIRFEI